MRKAVRPESLRDHMQGFPVVWRDDVVRGLCDGYLVNNGATG